MSIIFIEHLKDNKIIGLWHITETLDTLKNKITLTALDELHYRKRATLAKKREWLASRILIQEMKKTLCRIDYDTYGKPFDLDGNVQLSISHSHAYCCVYIDSTDCVGIDIQKLKTPFQSGLDYFLNTTEMQWVDSENNALINLIWSIKETIFKFVGLYELNFKESITIPPVDLTQPVPVVCSIALADKTLKIPVDYRFFGDYVLTYTC
jgi:4'-phosphopantetheinyl transferase